MNRKEKAEIWKECFDKLLNTEEPKELIKKGIKEMNEVEVEELTIEDVKKAIRNLKNNILKRHMALHIGIHNGSV